MIIRELRQTDIDELKRIHDKFYKDEFTFPDFFNKFLCSFVIISEDDRIISGGGVRPIAESILVTNKDIPVRIRREALYRMLDASSYVAKTSGYDQLHAFIQSYSWEQQLMKIGFKTCKGNALFLNI